MAREVSEMGQEIRALPDPEKERLLREHLQELDGPPDARAGCTRLDSFRQSGEMTPLVIYLDQVHQEIKRRHKDMGPMAARIAPSYSLSMSFAHSTVRPDSSFHPRRASLRLPATGEINRQASSYG